MPAQLFYNPDIAPSIEARADFPPEPASAREARRFVTATLRTWSCEPMLDAAELLVSELVANAVLHARTLIGVRIRYNGERLRVEVHDGERRAPARKHYSALATTGRGLFLVERIARDWGVTTDVNGKSVWFELDAASAAAAEPGAIALDLDLDEVELHGAGKPASRGPHAFRWQAPPRAERRQLAPTARAR